MFEGDYKLNYHLAPPLIAKRNDKGELQKRKFGPAMLTAFRVLASSRACAARRSTSSAGPRSAGPSAR